MKMFDHVVTIARVQTFAVYAAVLMCGLVFFVYPPNVHALHLTPEMLAVAEQTGLDSVEQLAADIGFNELQILITTEGVTKTATFINSAGATDVGTFINSVGLTPTLTVLGDVGPQEAASFINFAGVTNAADFLNIEGSEFTGFFINDSGGTTAGLIIDELSGPTAAILFDGIGGNLSDAFNASSLFADFVNQTPLNQVIAIFDTANQISGDIFGNFLNQVGVGDIVGFLSQATGFDLGGLLNVAGIGDIVDVFSQTIGGIDFGQVVDFFGSGGIADIFGNAGGDLLGGALSAVGASGVFDAIAGAGGLDAALSGLVTLFSGLFGGGGSAGPCGFVGAKGITGIPAPGPQIALGFGLHVPVKDFEAEAYLVTIMFNTFATGVNTANIQGTNDTIRALLKDLCVKEYYLDPALQHAWARVIANLVDETYRWVTTAYAGNPIFVTNQYVYYTLVDLGVYLTYRKEIEQSPIGLETKKELLKQLDRRQYEYLFPTTPFNDPGLPSNLQGWAPDNLSATIAEYTPPNDPNGWGLWHTTFVRDEKNFAGTFQYSEKEFERRRERALAIEQEKLAWGRGFLSYELCDLAIWTDIREDRRNCRIVTPGSLIQDQVAFVFGSSLRQMELADEFEEWIAPNTIIVLNDSLNFNGILAREPRYFDLPEPFEPVKPSIINSLIESGDSPDIDILPWELQAVIIDFEFEGGEGGPFFEEVIKELLPPPIQE